jgi:hypothetical protein
MDCAPLHAISHVQDAGLSCLPDSGGDYSSSVKHRLNGIHRPHSLLTCLLRADINGRERRKIFMFDRPNRPCFLPAKESVARLFR